MWIYFLIFIAAALFGVVYGKKAHLRQLGNILLQNGMPIDEVSKLTECVRTYNKSPARYTERFFGSDRGIRSYFGRLLEAG